MNVNTGHALPLQAEHIQLRRCEMRSDEVRAKGLSENTSSLTRLPEVRINSLPDTCIIPKFLYSKIGHNGTCSRPERKKGTLHQSTTIQLISNPRPLLTKLAGLCRVPQAGSVPFSATGNM